MSEVNVSDLAGQVLVSVVINREYDFEGVPGNWTIEFQPSGLFKDTVCFHTQSAEYRMYSENAFGSYIVDAKGDVLDIINSKLVLVSESTKDSITTFEFRTAKGHVTILWKNNSKICFELVKQTCTTGETEVVENISTSSTNPHLQKAISFLEQVKPNRLEDFLKFCSDSGVKLNTEQLFSAERIVNMPGRTGKTTLLELLLQFDSVYSSPDRRRKVKAACSRPYVSF